MSWLQAITSDLNAGLSLATGIVNKLSQGISDLFLEGDIKVYKIGRNPAQCADSSTEQAVLNQALEEFKVMTCVQFVPRAADLDYLYIDSGTSCWSYIGKIGGKQDVGLAQGGCLGYGRIQHELMHSLGFYHEQNRFDRDNYIDILWNNIPSYNQANFDIDDGDTQNLPYDYLSVVHFDSYDYSTGPNIPAYLIKSDPSIRVSVKIGMTNIDVQKINTFYGCTNLCRSKFVKSADVFSYNSYSAGQSQGRCLFLIQSTDLILLQLGNLNIPASPDCSMGYLKIYDGMTNSSPVLWNKACGKGPIPSIVSSGAFMLVEMVNNQPQVLSSFTASYNRVNYGGMLFSNSGVVKSQYFPNFTPSNTDSSWTIVASAGCKVSLTFTFFLLRNTDGCSLEYLLIRDGSAEGAPVLRRLCSYVDPTTPPVVSSGNVMTLQYHKSDVAEGRGFMLSYSCVSVK
ncbi:embryonic protein UVS.2-like [Gastrophryne carolinensis]